jgi:hypothetical protein
MQIQYERDDTRQRVTVTLRGPYAASEILALFERHRVEDDWRYERIYDVRHVTGKPTLDELRQFMSLDAHHRPHGPEAILTRDPILFALACAYAALGRSTLSIQVFRDLAEAEQWLAAQANESDAST